jgi:TPR repeat protein
MNTNRFLIVAALALSCGSPIRAADASATSDTLSGASPAEGLVGSLGRRDALVLAGNRSFTVDQINSSLRLQIDFMLAGHPAAPLQDYLTALEELIQKGYRRKGFPTAQVKATVDQARGKVMVKIEEGPRYTTGKVTYSGVPAIQNQELQQRLTDALAGWNAPTTSTGISNAATALWPEKGFAPFDENATAELRERLTTELAKENFYHPDLAVSILPNPSEKTAELRIEMKNEGLKGMIDQIEVHYPIKEKKNTDEELLKFLGLQTGMPFSANLLENVTNRLWESGRFFRQDAELVPLPQVGRFKLDLNLEEAEDAPPLREPLSLNETVFLKLAKWLNEFQAHPEDLLMSSQLDHPVLGMVSVDIALSKAGLAWLARVGASNSTPKFAYGMVLSERLVGYYSGLRNRRLVSPGEHKIKAFVSVTPKPDATKPSEYTLTVGAGMGNVKDDPPMSLALTVAPSKFLGLAHAKDISSSLNDGRLNARFMDKQSQTPFQFTVETATGRPLEISAEGRTNDVHVKLEVRAEEGAYARVVSEIASASSGWKNDYLAEGPLSSWAGFMAGDLFESGVLDSSFFSNYLRQSVSPQQSAEIARVGRQIHQGLEKLKTALGQPDIAHCLLPMEKKLAGLLPSKDDNSEAEEDDFSIPQKHAAQSQMAAMLALGAAWVADKSDLAWPRDSWPWILSREAAFTIAGRNVYTSRELGKLLASSQTGPLGCWAAGALLARVNAPLAEKFIQRGLEQLTLERLQADVDTLLATETIVGQLLGEALHHLADIRDSDLDALTRLFSKETREFLQETTTDLRGGTNRPPAVVLQPVIERHWTSLLKPTLEAELNSWLTKVGAPSTPEKAFERAVFLEQGATRPEEMSEALKCYLFAAERGYGKAQLRLGNLYGEGKQVSQDYGEALKWFVRAADQKEPHAACRVADIYFQGLGLPLDKPMALEWYQREATNSCARSQFMVGLCAEAESRPLDALYWFRCAATNGFVKAAAMLGDRLSDILAADPNYAEAYLWYQFAAEKGDRVAAVSARRVKTKLTEALIAAADKQVEELLRQRSNDTGPLRGRN